MPKFTVYGNYSVGVYLGVVEADPADDAKAIAEDDFLDATVGLCYQCSRKLDSTVTCVSIDADLTDECADVRWEREP